MQPQICLYDTFLDSHATFNYNCSSILKLSWTLKWMAVAGCISLLNGSSSSMSIMLHTIQYRLYKNTFFFFCFNNLLICIIHITIQQSSKVFCWKHIDTFKNVNFSNFSSYILFQSVVILQLCCLKTDTVVICSASPLFSGCCLLPAVVNVMVSWVLGWQV